MDCNNIHDDRIAPNPHLTSELTSFIPVDASSQHFHQPPPPHFQQSTPQHQWHRTSSQSQQQFPAHPSGSRPPPTFLGSVPQSFLAPLRQMMNQIHQLARQLHTDTEMASLFLVFEQDQFNGLVRKVAIEALLSGMYGFRVQVERIKFYNAPDDTLGIQVPMNNPPITNSQSFDSGLASMVPGVPITPPTSTTTTPSVSVAAPSSAPPSTDLNVTCVSDLGDWTQPIDLTGDDEPTAVELTNVEPIAVENTATSITTPTSPTSQISPAVPSTTSSTSQLSPAVPCTTSPTSTDSSTTNNAESRKRSRDAAAIDLDATTTHQPPSKKPKGPLSNFRKDGPPILYEHRVENYLIPYVRYYDSRAGTVRDVSYEIYKAEYGEMSTRWRELQGELEELHGKRRRLGVWLDIEEKKKKRKKEGEHKAEKNAGAVFGPVEQATPSSSSSVATVTTETNVCDAWKAEEGCDNDDDGDDFARICESVWDSVDNEEEATVASG